MLMHKICTRLVCVNGKYHWIPQSTPWSTDSKTALDYLAWGNILNRDSKSLNFFFAGLNFYNNKKEEGEEGEEKVE